MAYKLSVAWLGLAVVAFSVFSAAEESEPADLSDRWLADQVEKLEAINQSIWSRPEVGLKEHHAAVEMTRLLEEAGFSTSCSNSRHEYSKGRFVYPVTVIRRVITC